MNGEYETKLRALRSSINAAEGAPFSIEPELSDLLSSGQREPSLASDLLLSLSDHSHSGAMYSFVHAAEALQPSTYTSILLSLLPELVGSSPNWSLELLRRIMNHDASFNELVRQVEAGPAPVKEAVRIVGASNDAIRPDYLPQEVKARLARAAS